MVSTVQNLKTSDTSHAFESILRAYQARVDAALLERLPSTVSPSTQLPVAMKYAVTNGGKRVRPVLAYATGKAGLYGPGAQQRSSADRHSQAFDRPSIWKLSGIN